ncbi:MAG: 50S ribosomal protein L24 [Candidatus Moraniibacteriota bacterium]
MKIKKGDKVQIMAGKDKGSQGEVLHVFPVAEKIVVKGVNIMKRHVRAKREGEKGERVEKEAPLHVSNVMLVCPHTNKPTRVGYKIEGGEKIRMSKRAGKAL